jgi:hypothetical protein
MRVFHEDADPVTALDAEPDESRGEFADPPNHLRCRHVDELVALADCQSGVVAGGLLVGEQRGDDVVVRLDLYGVRLGVLLHVTDRTELQIVAWTVLPPAYGAFERQSYEAIAATSTPNSSSRISPRWRRSASRTIASARAMSACPPLI